MEFLLCLAQDVVQPFHGEMDTMPRIGIVPSAATLRNLLLKDRARAVSTTTDVGWLMPTPRGDGIRRSQCSIVGAIYTGTLPASSRACAPKVLINRNSVEAIQRVCTGFRKSAIEARLAWCVVVDVEPSPVVGVEP